MALPLQMLRLEIPALHRCSSSLPLNRFPFHHHRHHRFGSPSRPSSLVFPPRRPRVFVLVGKEETELRTSPDELENADPEDVQLVRQIQRVLELLRKNRDMLFNEVFYSTHLKLSISGFPSIYLFLCTWNGHF